MGEKSTSTILELENSSQANMNNCGNGIPKVKLRRLVYSGDWRGAYAKLVQLEDRQQAVCSLLYTRDLPNYQQPLL